MTNALLKMTRGSLPAPHRKDLYLTPDELWLSTICTHNKLAITDIQMQLLSRYRELLLEWNGKINLISRKDQEHAWDTHILLSLAHLFLVRFPGHGRILDLGTGGGLPGIPLSIMLPECEFTLVDSIRKKTTAVAAIVEALGLTNVKVVNARAEEINHLPQHANIYDIVTARSVSDLTNLLTWALPFLRRRSGADTAPGDPGAPLVRSSLVTLKGMEIDTELAAVRKAFPRAVIESRPLVFRGSEALTNTDKQLIIAHL
jgi:16S rRNA (guanine527-N7)-methyltransferase